jgi:hypothetical protein
MRERFLGGGRELGRVCAAVVWVLLATAWGHAQTGGESSVGYIDSAIPATQFRLRLDAAYDNNRPERADFFYPMGGLAPRFETRVNYQEFSNYLELAASPRLSGFAELPFRWVNPQQNTNHHDISDVNFGFKYALLSDPDQVLTLQLRTYAPTGDDTRGLGTGHWTVEPALLFYQRLSEKWTFEGEFRDWVPIDAPDNFAGNVIRYGAGLSYRAYDRPSLRITPVTELVGWTVLGGKDEVGPGVVVTAKGETIVNVKTGLRFFFGDGTESGLLGKSDLYVGYGRALTGEVWYKNTFRVEFRLRF